MTLDGVIGALFGEFMYFWAMEKRFYPDLI